MTMFKIILLSCATFTMNEGCSTKFHSYNIINIINGATDLRLFQCMYAQMRLVKN